MMPSSILVSPDRQTGSLGPITVRAINRLPKDSAACGRLCRNGSTNRRKRMTTGTNAFPVLRWVGLLWTVVWLPAYIRFWGWANLLHLCDIAVILGCAGLWWGSSLLISSQARISLSAGVSFFFYTLLAPLVAPAFFC